MDNKCVEKLLETVAFSNGCICSVELIRWEHTHFHPSGNLEPSKQDISLTNRMIEVFSLMGIPLVDHVIVGGDNRSFYSMHEKGIVDFDRRTVYSNLIDTLKFQKVAEEVPKGIVAADWRKETLGYGNVHEERARDGKKR